MLGLVLFFVGAVLCLNGLWLLGRIGDNEIAVIDYFVGGITLAASLYLAFGPGSDAASIRAAAYTLLFSFTYLWVALNRSNGADGRGLGWFCLFVAVTAVPVTLQAFSTAQSTWDDRPEHLGRLVRAVLGRLGRALAAVLRAAGHEEADRQVRRRRHRGPGRAHRLAAGLPAAQRPDRLTARCRCTTTTARAAGRSARSGR